MNAQPPNTTDGNPQKFFVLVFVLSTPFWLAGHLTSRQLLPDLPVSALAFLCPFAAAMILVYRAHGSAGAVSLLKRTLDYARVKHGVWYIPALLLMPGIMGASYAVQHLMGVQVPALDLSWPQALILFSVFFIGALGEELGWSGYATDPLQEKAGALGASMLIGTVWAIWHFVPLLEANRSVEFIAWWSLGTLALRVIIVWLYNNAGKSVFMVALFHAMINLSWQLYPVSGSYYDPQVTGLITVGIALPIVILWGPRRLSGSHEAAR